MKKKLVIVSILILCMVLFASCDQNKTNMIESKCGDYYNKNWEETAGTYTGAAIPNKETAIEITKAIFSGMDKSKEAEEYVPQAVFL